MPWCLFPKVQNWRENDSRFVAKMQQILNSDIFRGKPQLYLQTDRRQFPSSTIAIACLAAILGVFQTSQTICSESKRSAKNYRIASRITASDSTSQSCRDAAAVEDMGTWDFGRSCKVMHVLLSPFSSAKY